ncbi:hypothetical protein GO003_019365 [Methylicorpusculum oleiharenae]|nr:hypothetical protein [Methylicorpusculum oleiharenae]MCD2452548.1 hypothetical protein [Methylicorpusculum oleiharenae]
MCNGEEVTCVGTGENDNIRRIVFDDFFAPMELPGFASRLIISGSYF